MSENTLVWTAVLSTAGFQAGISAISSGIQGILGVVQSVASGITSTLSSAFNAVKNVISTIASTISGALSSAFGVVTGIASAFIGLITGGFASISGVLSGVAGVITGVLGGAFNILSSIATGVFNVLQTAAQAAFEILTEVATISFEALAVGIMAVVAALGYLAVTGIKAYGTIQEAASGVANKVSAITGKSIKDTKQQYMDMATDLSKQSKYTAENIGTSMSSIISAAWSKNPNATKDQIEQMVQPITDMATGLGVPLQQASDMVTSTMKQFSIPFDQTQQTVNSMTDAVLKSKMSVDDYAQVLQTLGPVAAAVGMPLSELEGQITTLGQMGVNPSSMTTGLQMALTKSGKLSDELSNYLGQQDDTTQKYQNSVAKWEQNAATAASKGKAFTTPYPQEPKSLQQAAAGTEITPGAVLAKYGFTPDELKNAGPEDVAAQMVERGQRMGYNQAQIISNIGEVTGAQRGGGALTLYDLGLAKLNGTLDKNTKLIQSNKNAAKDAAATYKDDLDDALDQTGKAISGVGDQFGKVLGPKLTDALNNNVIPTINSIGDAIGKALSGDWSGFTDAINGMLESAKSELTYQNAYNLGKWIMDQIANAIKAVSGIHWGTLWDELKNSFVGAMEGIRTSIYNNFGVDIAQIFNNVREQIINAFTSIVGAVENTWVTLQAKANDVETFFYNMQTAATNAVNGIIDAIVGLVNVLEGSLINAINDVVGSFADLGGAAIDALNKASSAVGVGNLIDQTPIGKTAQSLAEKIPSGSPQDIANEAGLSVHDFIMQPFSTSKNTGGLTTDVQTQDYNGPGGTGEYAAGSYGAPSQPTGNTGSQFTAATPGIISTGTTGVLGSSSYVPSASAPGSPSSSGTSGSSGTGVGDYNPNPSQEQLNAMGFSNAQQLQDYQAAHGQSPTVNNQPVSNVNPMPVAIQSSTTGQTAGQIWAANQKAQYGLAPYTPLNAKDYEVNGPLSQPSTFDQAAAQQTADATTKAFHDNLEGIIPQWSSPIDQNTGALKSNLSALQDVNNRVFDLWNSTGKSLDASTAQTDATQGSTDATQGSTDATQGSTDATQELTSQLHAQNVGYDALKDALGSCTETMSAFGQQQEGNPDLFYGSYIGASGPAYDTWKANETNRQIQAANSDAANGTAMLGSIQKYVGQTPVEIPVTANTDSATQSIQDVVNTAQSANPVISVGADVSSAYTAIDSAVAYANSSSAQLNVGGSSGVSAANPGNPYLDTSEWAGLTYAEGTDFVPYDQIAKLHYGEAVVTAQKNKSVGENPMHLTYSPTIVIGTGVDKPTIERALKDQMEKHTQDMQKVLVNMARGNR